MNPVLEQSGALNSHSLSDRWSAPADHYDELRGGVEGEPLPHWSKLFDQIDRLGEHEFARRWEQAARLNRESGTVYQVTRTERDQGVHSWRLDPIPLLLTENEWNTIEAGVIQRATLLSRVLEDLYGRQDLLREGLLPSHAVYANPGFLRPCHGTRLHGSQHLPFYAVDLARSPDGRWWAVADHTETPSGMGYALENRRILSRTFHEIFANMGVCRLQPFFNALREAMRQHATFNRHNPLIAFLSPGPDDPLYFEQAYLARTLGYPLVEGADLMVRDGCVFVKTLSGLQRIDVIFRQLADHLCDPLELLYESPHGVPGLVQAVRTGNVSIVNPLGSGLVDCPAMTAFLEYLSRHLLGESLRIPSLATWWCGQSGPMQFVEENISRLEIIPAWEPGAWPTVKGWLLSDADRENLLARMREKPTEFAAREMIQPSAVPRWMAGQLHPSYLVLRVYTIATEDGFTVMPGALARVARSDNVSPAPDGLTSAEPLKDVWILSEKPVQPMTVPTPASAFLTVSRHALDQPSRVADNMFWLGRYVERADNTLRLQRSIFWRFTDESAREYLPELPALLRVMVACRLLAPGAAAPDSNRSTRDLDALLLGTLLSRDNPASLKSCLDSLHRTALIVRDRISNDAWRILSDLGDELADYEQAPATMVDAYALMNRLILTLASFSGLAMESMTRGPSWRFLDMGRRIERAVFLVDLLRGATQQLDRDEPDVLQAILEVADSSMTYRSRYLSTLQLAPLLDLLFVDETNPRSVAFQLMMLTEHLELVPKDRLRPARGPEERMVLAALADARSADVVALAERDTSGGRNDLAMLLARFADTLPEISERLSATYFSHTEVPVVLGTTVPVLKDEGL